MSDVLPSAYRKWGGLFRASIPNSLRRMLSEKRFFLPLGVLNDEMVTLSPSSLNLTRLEMTESNLRPPEMPPMEPWTDRFWRQQPSAAVRGSERKLQFEPPSIMTRSQKPPWRWWEWWSLPIADSPYCESLRLPPRPPPGGLTSSA